MAKVLIVGAGDVGARLALLLAADGHAVWALRRHPVPLPGVQVLAADVTRPDSLRLPAGLDVVVVVLSPGASGAAAYREVYVEGTRAVLAALQGQALKRVFWVSSTSVYGESAGEAVDEAAPARPVTATAALLLDAEALVRAAPWPATVVRFGGLYGPGRHRLLDWVAQARPVQRDPPSWSNRLHVEDAAGLLAHLAGIAAAGGALEPLYLGVDDCPVPQHEVLAWLAAEMGLPEPPGEVRPGGDAGKRVGNAALHRSGYRLRYPDYRAGYRQVLAARG